MPFIAYPYLPNFVRLSHSEDGKTTLCAEVYIYEGNTLIDSGSPANTPSLVSCLNTLHISPLSIERVILSHTHFDHFGDLSYFPNATVYIGPKSLDNLMKNPLDALDASFRYNVLSAKEESEWLVENMSSFRLESIEKLNLKEHKTKEEFAQSNGLSYLVAAGHTDEDLLFSYRQYRMFGDSLSFRGHHGPHSAFGIARYLMKNHPELMILKSHSGKPSETLSQMGSPVSSSGESHTL